jgi:GDP-4-dehydro-6-deoxy-D-mannose reductase
MRILITGASGFTGRHLADYGLQCGAIVYGLSRRSGVNPSIIELPGDLALPETIAEAMQASHPDYVFHLASQTPANAPTNTNHDWLTINPLATLNLLEAVRLYRPQARVLLVSSSAVYGHVPPADMPIHEHRPLHPTTMYGVSKATQELLAIRYASEYHMVVILARPFNLVGPGEPCGMVTSTLAAQVASIAAGQAVPVIRMRHRATQRDFTDIRDAVRAYWDILEHGQSGEVYNVCSGIPTPIGTIADQLISLASVSARIEETSAHPGTSDVLLQMGSTEKVAQSIGWQPRIDLDRSLADLLATFRP